MKIFKNKFILAIILCIFLIIFSQIFTVYSKNDTTSYATLIRGTAILNTVSMIVQEKYPLTIGDRIVTGEESLLIIEWGDGSVTRLASRSELEITDLEIYKNLTRINIGFELLSGKSWSNVVSFLGKDSSFTQKFEGIEAGVRGTVFDVDLYNNYIRVSDHQIELTDENGTKLTLPENLPLNLKTFEFIDLKEFLSTIEDKAWRELNTRFDTEKFFMMKRELEKSFKSNNPFLLLLELFSPKYRILFALDTDDDFSDIEKLIDTLSLRQKNKVYEGVLSRYQDYNFIQSSDYEYFKRKIFYKKALILLSPTQGDQEILLQSTSYDIASLISSKDNAMLGEYMSFLGNYASLLPKLDITQLQLKLSSLPEGLKDEFGLQISQLETLFQFDATVLKNIKIENIVSGAEKKLQNLLEENFGETLRNLIK